MVTLNWLFGLPVVQPVMNDPTSGESIREDIQPLPPTEDPWYEAPPDLDTKRAGEILKIRLAPGNLTAIIGDSLGTAYNILYRTTDSAGRPSWAVTTLLIPSSIYFTPSGKAVMVSYQFAYNSANPDSSPSFALYGKLAEENKHLGLKSSTSLLDQLLSQGWIVNTPDFAGPMAAFGATAQAGHATLDSIRSVQNLARLTGEAEMSIVIWGYSGGTTATAAAAEMQPTYAPELKLEGAILGGMANDLAGSFDRLNEGPIAGTIIAILLGITAQFPEARAYLKSCLIPETRDEFLSVLETEASKSVLHFSGKNIYSFFKGGKKDLYAPTLVELYETQMKIGDRSTPAMPMFIYHAIGDQVCPVDKVDDIVSKWREDGAHILFERNTVGTHVSEIENGKPRAMAWLRQMFGESYETSTCTIRNVTVEVSVDGA
ncbi:unnamed protein product [Clonostachys byssicola]|uniref:Uncharacterized protein n=1 Tax=Clonostachys byssicola TaxID=160290 RepID=A0A9N9UBN9_9HYPO|nr:unnamed protein product [Clonostachys byssicola]